MSETWLNEKHSENLSLHGFESIHVFGQKRTGVKKGRLSGGLSVYFKTELKKNISVIETNKSGILWLKLNKTLLSSNNDLYICHVDIPPPGSKVLLDKDFDFFEEIEKGIEKYNKLGNTFITGDFNSRIAQLPDLLPYDKYLDGDDDDNNDDDDDDHDDDDDDDDGKFHFNNLIQCNNRDNVIDNYGRKLVALCKSTDHMIAIGRLCNDLDGNFTFLSVRCYRLFDT